MDNKKKSSIDVASFLNQDITFTTTLTPEQASQFESFFSGFDVSHFIGKHCYLCRQEITEAYFESGGTVSDNGTSWVHTNCMPSEN